MFPAFRLSLVLILFSLTVSRAEESTIDFNRDIRPILSNHCYKCHGPDEEAREADLRLDTQAGAAAIDGGLATLIQRVTNEDADLIMPPSAAKIPLQPRQVELLKRWIKAGAPWGKHWSFEPLSQPTIPQPPEFKSVAVRNPIDSFVQSHLAKEKILPSKEASRETLIRRVTLDLTGLPPTPGEIDAFLNDESANAYEKVVERLLKTPAYGETMAWYWLNAARYADSNGYQGDRERTMWPWRDWVVDAFNRNLPYDEFTLWQLAGDQLPYASHEQKLATGFNRNHMINGEGGRIAEENRIEYVMDMTETTGTVWLGLTMNCCRCHDHKFDPISQSDYYRLFAFFNQTPVTGKGGDPQTPPVLATPGRDALKRVSEFETQLAQLSERFAQRQSALADQQDDWEQTKLKAGRSSTWSMLTPSKLTADHQSLTQLDDGSIFASGDNPKNDTYTVHLKTDLQTINAIRLDALRHKSHTTGGLARSNSGNFVLTEIEVSVNQPNEEKPMRIKIASATATYEQGDLKVEKAFDNNAGSGWAVYQGRPIDRDHAAIFRFAEPVALSEGSTITVVMRHDSVHASHNIGRFRISATDSPQAKLEDAPDLLSQALQTPSKERTAAQQQIVSAEYFQSDAEYRQLADEQAKLKNELAKYRGSFPKVMVMQDVPKQRATFILTRGQYNQPSDQVTAGTPSQLPQLPEEATPNRLALARWIVSDENPLTARVTVNRVWQQFFGIGLVKTVDNFGIQGEIPIHRDLFDWLAIDFRDQGWNVKRLVRLIVTSHTYRQSSHISTAPETSPKSWRRLSFGDDPENRMLARGARFRLPSHTLRDQALAASGLLVAKLGGAPVNGYQPAGVWEESTFGKKRYVQDHGDALYRRSLYTFWRRIIAPTIFFDSASRQTCTVNVLRTNTPLHALLTLNDVTFVEASRHLAQRVLTSDHTSDNDRINDIYRRLLARKASERELVILRAALQRSRAEFESEPAAAKRLLAIGESKRNESIEPVEHAAWTSLVLAVMNLDEALTKE